SDDPGVAAAPPAKLLRSGALKRSVPPCGSAAPAAALAASGALWRMMPFASLGSAPLALFACAPFPSFACAPLVFGKPELVNGCPFSDCHPAPGLGKLLSATMVVPLSSHSPIAPLVFWNKRSACPFGVK